MYWHIDTDIVSLLVIVALLICTVKLRTDQDNTIKDKRFSACLWTGVFVTLIDIAASVIMEVPTSAFFYHALMTLYFASIELLIIVWVLYAMAILYHDDEKRRKKVAKPILALFIAYLALVVSNPWTGLIYSLSENNLYQRGPCFFVMLGLYIVYTVMLMALVILRRKHIPKNYPIIVIGLIPVVLAGSIALQLLVPGWLMIMPGYMLCLLLAYLFLQTGMVRSERLRIYQLTELTERFASGFAISTIDQEHHIRIDYLNDRYFDLLDEKREPLTDRYEKDLFAGIHKDDRDMMIRAMESMERSHIGHEITYRYVTSAGQMKWLYVKAQVVEQPDGTATVYSTFTDVTSQMTLQKQLSDLVHTVPCGIAQYRWDGRELHPMIVNSRYTEMLGEDAMSYLQTVKGMDYTHVHPDDLQMLRKASLRALTKTHEIDVSYRSLNVKTMKYLWVQMRGTLIPQPDGTDFVYISYFDVTREHETQIKLRENEQLLESAAEYAGLWYWRYDVKNSRAYMDSKDHNAFGAPNMMDNYPQAWLDMGFVLEEYKQAYLDATERIKRGEKQVVFDARIRLKDDTAHWARFCFTGIRGADGETSSAVCTAMLIDAEKELWAKYELERKRVFADDGNLLAHTVVNLSTGYVLELANQLDPQNLDKFSYSQENADLLIDEKEREQFLALTDRDTLLKRYAQGETEFRIDYRRKMQDGDARWIRSSLHLIRDPRSADALLFEYWYDIEEEKMLELMYRSIASDSYDFVARINGRTRAFKVFPSERTAYNMPPLAGDDADEVTKVIYNDCELDSERESAIQNTLVENIRRNLRQYGRYQFTFREKQPGGTIRHKKITQYYIDEQREIIAMMREDVTELIRKETEKNEILASALETANQASHAKSQFLSRVSHELRTPLNGIIGFMELAKDATGAELKSYLVNSDASAKQLLSVINDVLDVSSIESGKLKIASSAFDFKHMLGAVTNLFVAQCEQKGLHYDTRIVTPIDEWLVGDQLRVNQILLNLLGNAVKFTQEGFVRLSVTQTQSEGDKVFLRFEVSDSGAGMSEELQKRLFKPFEQESALTAQKYGGSGLGLSIVSSLVNMMGGAVSVKSRLGEGSTFTVELPFLRGENGTALKPLDNTAGLRVLVVDDEAIEREYLSVVLARIGVRQTCVGGGSEALCTLDDAAAAGDPYNVCLVDWKMPEMNGLEITKRIRAKYGDHLVVIVVSAYEHYQADESARAAGANLFITKPLFQSSLFDLFSTLTGGRIATEKKEDAEKASFAGKRVLLVEDNAMNRIVAEGLVSRLGVECPTAADGQIAVDDYLSHEPGYYDAILMDIQMPNMDGFEATKAIRNSGRADAKMIQIIALTANAFNEDIAKTLSGGMNAHVSKPIEPDRLAQALSKAFERKYES